MKGQFILLGFEILKMGVRGNRLGVFQKIENKHMMATDGPTWLKILEKSIEQISRKTQEKSMKGLKGIKGLFPKFWNGDIIVLDGLYWYFVHNFSKQARIAVVRRTT